MVSNKSMIILLGILLSISSAQKTICEQIILEPVKDIMKLNFSSLPLPSIMYSGITNNNPGQMMECQDKNYSYFLVYYNNATTLLDTYTGLCLPPQCTAQDIERVLQVIHPKAYDFPLETEYDSLTIIGFVVISLWLSILIVWSSVMSCKQPVINEYLQNEKERGSINMDQPEQPLLEGEEKEPSFKLFNFYEGYSKLFKVPSKRNIFSPIMFLSVLSFAVSTEFSYRQTIAENENHSAANILNSFWGIFVCNTEIALDTIIFILGVRLAYGVYKIKTFTAIGRFFFDQLIQKWLLFILMTFLIYSFLAFTQQPLSKIWELNYGKDCPGYMWQMWFLFRNLQLDCKACLPWLSLLESEILFTILAAPFIIFYRVNKKLGHALFGLIIFISMLISYAILDDEKILFLPLRLSNGQKQFALNYQSNSFVRMGSFFFGLFAGLFIIEGMAKNKEKTFEEQLAKTMRKSSKRQYFLHFLGLAIVIVTYSMVALFFNVGPLDNPTSSSYWYLVLTPLAFLVGLTVFLIPCFWEGNTKLTRLINKVLGWKKWVHLDKISINFYALAPMLIGFITYSMQSSIYYDYLTIFTYLLGDLFLVYLLSVVCTAAFENQLKVLSSWVEVKIFGKESKYSILVIEE